jgi:pSer/pThr/pTyr-binding forkhead associated (FHA) protein
MEKHQFMFLDKSSKYGSYINGTKSQQSILGPDDEIRIGPYTIHVSPFIPESHKQTQ